MSVRVKHEDSGQEPKQRNCSADQPSSDRPSDRWIASASTTPKSISASSSSTASSSDAWNVLDLSVGGRGSTESSAKLAWTDAVTSGAVSSTIDASPYLARRSLILDAPAVDRKCFGGGDQAPQPVGGVRGSSLTAAGKRFNHHRRRTTPMPLVKSK